MRYFLLLIIILFTTATRAQTITGIVADSTTRLGLPGVRINSKNTFAVTDGAGRFMINTEKIDTLRFQLKNYNARQVAAGNQSTLIILLKRTPTQLKEVTINGQHTRIQDSIDNRQQFAKVFNYTPPKVTDAIGSPMAGVPFAFFSIDLLTLVKALTKNSDPTYKLKKLMLKDEKADYIHSRYNRGLVAGITHLKGDSLQLFVDKYYPTLAWLQKASDYDLMEYVKKNYVEFVVKKKD